MRAEIKDVERCLGETHRLSLRDPGRYESQIAQFAARMRHLHERLTELDTGCRGGVGKITIAI